MPVQINLNRLGTDQKNLSDIFSKIRVKTLKIIGLYMSRTSCFCRIMKKINNVVHEKQSSSAANAERLQESSLKQI